MNTYTRAMIGIPGRYSSNARGQGWSSFVAA